MGRGWSWSLIQSCGAGTACRPDVAAPFGMPRCSPWTGRGPPRAGRSFDRAGDSSAAGGRGTGRRPSAPLHLKDEHHSDGRKYLTTCEAPSSNLWNNSRAEPLAMEPIRSRTSGASAARPMSAGRPNAGDRDSPVSGVREPLLTEGSLRSAAYEVVRGSARHAVQALAQLLLPVEVRVHGLLLLALSEARDDEPRPFALGLGQRIHEGIAADGLLDALGADLVAVEGLLEVEEVHAADVRRRLLVRIGE